MLSFKEKVMLLVVDAIFFVALVALFFFFRTGESPTLVFSAFGFWLILGIGLMSFYTFGAYEISSDQGFKSSLVPFLVAIFFATSLVVLGNYLFFKERTGVFGRGVLLGSYAAFFLFAGTYRYFIWRHLKRIKPFLRYLFVVAHAEQKNQVGGELGKLGFSYPYELCLVGDFHNLTEKKGLEFKRVVLAFKDRELGDHSARLFMELRFKGQKILDWASFVEGLWQRLPVEFLNYDWFVYSDGFKIFANPLRSRVKRLFDLIVASSLLFLVWPLILLSAILIKFDSRGPVFFLQKRTGLRGVDFTIYKLRTMGVDAEKNGAQWAQQKDSRVTKVGYWLRITRLDELPQLLNVLKGEMSFVGPRPERPEFNSVLERQIPFYQVRHLVRPGLTGWAQIRYPYGASVEDAKNKLEYDLYYIKHHSLILDILIFFRTIRIVLMGKGR